MPTFKKLENYNKIKEWDKEGLSNKQIADKLGFLSIRNVQKIRQWGKELDKENDLIGSIQDVPETKKLFKRFGDKLKFYNSVIPKHHKDIYYRESFEDLGISNSKISYLDKVQATSHLTEFSKLKLRYLILFHNNWIDILVTNQFENYENRIPTDTGQISWLYLIAGLQACSEIFIDSRLSQLFEALASHIRATRPYILRKSWNDKKEFEKLRFSERIKEFIKINPEIEKKEVIAATKRIQEYMPKAKKYSVEIIKELKELRSAHIGSLGTFIKVLEHIIPKPVSLSKARDLKAQKTVIDTWQFFTSELIKLSGFGMFKLYSKDCEKMSNKEFINEHLKNIYLNNKSIFDDLEGYKDYVLWQRENTIKKVLKMN